MSRRTRIEWFTGEKLGYPTADELGLGEFVSTTRKLQSYLDLARWKKRNRAKQLEIFRLARKTKNPKLTLSVEQRRRGMARNRFWKAQGYPNLRRAWEARRRNCARRREEKALAAKLEAQRRELERYGL